LIKLLTYLKGDRVVWMIAFLLAAVSLLSVYSSISSLAYKHYDGNTLHYLFKHGTMLMLGVLQGGMAFWHWPLALAMFAVLAVWRNR